MATSELLTFAFCQLERVVVVVDLNSMLDRRLVGLNLNTVANCTSQFPFYHATLHDRLSCSSRTIRVRSHLTSKLCSCSLNRKGNLVKVTTDQQDHIIGSIALSTVKVKHWLNKFSLRKRFYQVLVQT